MANVEGKRDRVVNRKGLLVTGILSLCIVFGAVQYAVPVYGSEDSLPAEATVTSPSAESYGASVAASSRVFLPQHAPGEPDGRGAWMLRRGWIDIELEDTVTGCTNISIWTVKRDWRSPSFKVYVSADGSTWTYIGGCKCTSTGYTRYDFSGIFGDVRYIKVRRNGSGRWSVMLLDAVRAKGGDA